MDSSSQPPDPSLIDEVLRRVGRNLLLLQNIERALKTVLSGAGIGGSESFSQLTQHYHDEVLGRNEAWFSYEFATKGNQEVIERDRAMLDALGDERDDLAHGFLARWDPASIASTQEALAYLDAQRERALPVRDHLRSLQAAFNNASGHHDFEHLISDAGGRQFEAWLQRCRIVQSFARIAEASARPDGWTVFARAAQLVRDLAGDETDDAKDEHDLGSLMRLVVASGLFEVLEEPDGDTSTRTIYRIKRPA